MNHFGDGVLLAGLLDERDEERSLLFEDASLEQFHEACDGNAFLGEGGFDFVESREGDRGR